MGIKLPNSLYHIDLPRQFAPVVNYNGIKIIKVNVNGIIMTLTFPNKFEHRIVDNIIEILPAKDSSDSSKSIDFERSDSSELR